MAKRPSKQDAVKAKAAKQKKIAIGGGVLLVALLVFQVPRTMKLLNQKPAPPLNAPVSTTATPTVTPSDPNSLAAPTLGGTPTAATTTTTSSDLVDAVPVSADPGQLEAFQKFASKDPFAVQASSSGSASSGGGSSTSGGSSTAGGSSTPTSPTPPASPPSNPSPPSSPSSPSTPAPTSAIISLNGELMSVSAGGDFPLSGATFTRAGTLFHLVSVTAKTVKIAIVGGSYADGAPAITLKMGVPLTLQNTADGTKYTLILEPPTTQLPGATATGSVASPPASTTPTSAVPSGSGG